MAEHGYFHAHRGYWQAITDPDPVMLSSYPSGTVEVPLKPGEYFEWTGSVWQEYAPDPEDLRQKMPPVTARQLRLTLVRRGHSLASIDAAIQALPEGQAKDEAAIEWEYATQFERLAPTLLTIAAALSISAEDIDTMWQQAMAA